MTGWDATAVRGRAMLASCVLLPGFVLALGGCNTLPASGPVERDILNSETSAENRIGFRIVDLDSAAVAAVASAPPAGLQVLEAADRGGGGADRIGVGDILSISIFEVGNSLFAPAPSPAAQAQAQAAGPTGSVSNITLPPELVDATGQVDIPYAGRIRAAGATPAQLAGRIQDALAGQSQKPQVIVNVMENLANTVVVSGDVKSPGRRPLTLAHERILDMVAIAGGPTHSEQDTFVQLTRQGRAARTLLTSLAADADQNVLLVPGDRLQLIFQPRTFTLFGAAEKVQQLSFDAPSLSIAEALARGGGPSNYVADPNAVFLFRFEAPDIARRLGRVPPPTAVAAGTVGGAPPVPIIYHLDMMRPTSYFVAQQFPMRDKDVLYVANARTDRLGKFFGLIAALVSPAVTARYISQ